MNRETKVKEAIKTALSLAMVYGIALKAGWMNPYWAGFAVAFIALSCIGQSLHKGLLRIAGTIPGCIVALIILGLAGQSRWLFMLLVCAWIFFTTYMMLVDKERAYFWNVAGFVCLIITLAGPQSSEVAFQHAIFRSLETGMGVVVYTLVAVFLWPQSSAGSVKQARRGLLDTQARLFSAICGILDGLSTKEEAIKLRKLEAEQLDSSAQAVQAESAENYEVYEVRREWQRLHGLCEALMEAMNSWMVGFEQLSQIDIAAVFSNFQRFSSTIEERFELIQRTLDGQSSTAPLDKVTIACDEAVLRRLSFLDRAAVELAKK